MVQYCYGMVCGGTVRYVALWYGIVRSCAVWYGMACALPWCFLKAVGAERRREGGGGRAPILVMTQGRAGASIQMVYFHRSNYKRRLYEKKQPKRQQNKTISNTAAASGLYQVYGRILWVLIVESWRLERGWRVGLRAGREPGWLGGSFQSRGEN